MNGDPVYDFLPAELDAQMLAIPFEVQTRWYVLTGAACTGKTTMINQLAGLGFETVPETARIHIDRELAKGRTFDDIFGNPADELLITDMQRRFEQKLRAEDVVFLDRGLPDSITFYRFCGMSPDEIVPDCLRHRYAMVFILDRLPFCQDEARLEHDPTSELLDEWLERDYRALGYDVLRVPVMSREERLEYLLERVDVVER